MGLKEKGMGSAILKGLSVDYFVTDSHKVTWGVRDKIAHTLGWSDFSFNFFGQSDYRRIPLDTAGSLKCYNIYHFNL